MSPAPEASWLEDGGFVLLHRPAASSAHAGAAVLMCAPFGWEEVCSYRARRAWSLALAEAGYPCARLELPGAGNGAGGPRDSGRLEAWTAAVGEAASWLRAETECARLLALGMGLGGMLAVLAAQAGAPIDDFLLWGVPSRGRALLRAMRAYAAVVSARYQEDARPELLGGDEELTGFRLTAELAAALEAVRLDPGALPPDPRRRVLLLGRDGLPADSRLADGFERAGAAVTRGDGNDYEVLAGPPQDTGAPQETIARSLSWLDEAGEPPPPGEEAASTRPLASPELAAEGFSETGWSPSGELAGCFGVVTRPAPEADRGLCAVWLNAGAIHHIGPNRLWVETARRWAARGVSSVRIDLPGLGESEGGPLGALPDASFYREEQVRAARAILDALAADGVAERFIVGGLCSGAYWALHAALADPRVAGLMLINLYAFFWSPELVAERDTAGSLEAMTGRAWKRLLKGQVTGAQVRRAMSALSPGRLRRGAGHPVERRQAAAVEAALDRLRDQGTETLILLSRGESLSDQLRRQGVLDEGARWPNLVVEPIPTREHMFRALWCQAHVSQALDGALERVLGESPIGDSPGSFAARNVPG